MNRKKPYYLDYYFSKFKCYRKHRKGVWYKHKFTVDALALSTTFTGTWWARYSKINRYSDVIKTEDYDKGDLREYKINKFINDFTQNGVASTDIALTDKEISYVYNQVVK